MLLLALLLPVRAVLAAAVPCATLPSAQLVVAKAPAAIPVSEHAGGHGGHRHGPIDEGDALTVTVMAGHDHGGMASGDGEHARCLDCLSACCHVPALAAGLAFALAAPGGDALPPPLLPAVEWRPAASDRPPRTL